MVAELRKGSENILSTRKAAADQGPWEYVPGWHLFLPPFVTLDAPLTVR